MPDLFGVDLTLPIFLLGSFAGLAVIEYVLCRKVTWKWIRLLPWGYAGFWLVISVNTLLGDSGGWIDLRNFFAIIFAVYAAVCGCGILLGWHLARKKSK